MTWPALVLWVLILIGLFKPAKFMLYLFFAAGTFGGLSLLPPGAAGNVPVETVCAAVLVAKTFVGRRPLRVFLNYAVDFQKLGLLAMFSLYMVVTAFLFPRLFAGSVKVYSLNAAGNISFLSPSSANITQPIYMLVSTGMTFVFAYCGRNQTFRNDFLHASFFGATLLLGSGIIDMILGDAGREDVLLPFHNATYTLLNTVTIAGQKRVVGFMPEASVFGAACCANLSFLVLNRQAYCGRLRNFGVPVVAIGLLMMIYLSTSTSAYIGLAALAFVLVVKFIFEMVFVKHFTAAYFRKFLWIIGGAAAGLVVFSLLSHAYLMHVRLLLDEVLFEKNSSSSYFERNSWTQAGIAAFWTTHGLGVGFGSLRTSNWFVNFAASTGFVGLFLFGIFALKMVLPSRVYPDALSRHFSNGLKLALIPEFAVGLLVGTTPNPGPTMMLTLGLIFALRQKRNTAAVANAVETTRIPRRPVKMVAGSGARVA